MWAFRKRPWGKSLQITPRGKFRIENAQCARRMPLQAALDRLHELLLERVERGL